MPQSDCGRSDWSDWQKERERRRQELLAKRSKVMNRLLELRLEQEGEVDTREKREQLNRLLEMRLQQEGVCTTGLREGSFERNQSRNGNHGYDDKCDQWTSNPRGMSHPMNFQNSQQGRKSSEE